MADKDEKTEQPTSRKLRKSREEGQVGKSGEIPSVMVLITGVVTIFVLSSYLYDSIASVMVRGLTINSVPHVTPTYCVNILVKYSYLFFKIITPILLAVFAAAFLSNSAQVGFQISWKAIEPKFTKLNPFSGFMGKFFSSRALMELFKSVGKITIIFLVAYFAVKSEWDNLLRLYDNEVATMLVFIFELSLKIFIRVLIVMLFLALADYAYQKWKFTEEQKMTKQEVKDEHKDVEGDPKIKAKIRQIQMEAARKRMMSEVPQADVVVTNPTHLALAIKYDSQNMEVPRLVAKGAGAVAANIRKIATENNVPVVENKPLARNLYNLIEVGDDIPSEFYQAVAELLAYVYRLQGKI